MRLFAAILLHDLRVNLGAGGGVSFFFLAGISIPLALNASAPGQLDALAPVLIWFCLIAAALFSLDRLFEDDLEDGSCDLWVVAPVPLALAAAAKSASHWLRQGLPLAALAPLLALLLGLPPDRLGPLFLSLLAGSLGLSFLGALGAALAAGLARNAGLIFLLVLPLYLPFMIFGLRAGAVPLAGFLAAPETLCLLALTLAALLAAPFAAAAALRAALS